MNPDDIPAETYAAAKDAFDAAGNSFERGLRAALATVLTDQQQPPELVKVVLDFTDPVERGWRDVTPSDDEDPLRWENVVYEIPAEQHARWVNAVEAVEGMEHEIAQLMEERRRQGVEGRAARKAERARNAAAWNPRGGGV